MRGLRVAVVLMLGTMGAWAQEDAPTMKQEPASKVFAGKGAAGKKSVAAAPLTERERAMQMLNRFTFGARPGEVEKVLAMGTEKWFEGQLNPVGINDVAVEKRMGDYPTLGMTPAEVLAEFPDRGTIQRIVEGKQVAPTDPMLAGLYEVQMKKYSDEMEAKKVGADGAGVPPPTEEEKAAKKAADQAQAAEVAGELFALPKAQRMRALMKMPVTVRIAFTSYVTGDQKNLLLAEFNPRERELFYAMAANVGSQYLVVNELAQAKMVRAVMSERQVLEVMSDFWFNHFNVFMPKDADQWYTTSYERDAIRKNALGKFKDLLLATAESPAMMVYLDNLSSIGPNSEANGGKNANGKRGKGGLNENYAREVMELHTLSVKCEVSGDRKAVEAACGGGYTQADVTQLAAVLSGWGVEKQNLGGPFLFDAKRHEPGAKQWMGRTIAEGGRNEGVEALEILARHPATAKFICWKIAQRFVADDPPTALVERMAAAFLQSDGDIKTVLRTMVQSAEFNSRKYYRNKVKTPVEFVASTFRTTATDPTNVGAVTGVIERMGMPLFKAVPPTGYYITADHWFNTAALVDRLNFALQLTGGKFGGQKFDSAKLLAMGLMARPASKVAISGSGVDVAMGVLEGTLIGDAVSAQTNSLIRQQVEGGAGVGNPAETLNMLTALVMGSPEFQVR